MQWCVLRESQRLSWISGALVRMNQLQQSGFKWALGLSVFVMPWLLTFLNKTPLITNLVDESTIILKITKFIKMEEFEEVQFYIPNSGKLWKFLDHNAWEKLILNIKTRVRKYEREGNEITLMAIKRWLDSIKSSELDQWVIKSSWDVLFLLS